MRKCQEAGLKTFCYNLHWFKMKLKPKCTKLTKYIDLRKLGWDGDLQSSTSMVQFLLQKGAVYHLYCSEKFSKKTRERNSSKFKGEGGVPWVQIMENELECLGDRRGHDGHLTKKFLKKVYS